MHRYTSWVNGIVVFVFALWTSSAFGSIAAPPAATVHYDTKGQLAAYAKLDWSAHASGMNRATLIFKQDVYNIVKTLLGDDAPNQGIFKSMNLPYDALIQEYRFLDIDHTGKLALVIVVGDVCATCPNQVAIVKPVNGKLSMYEIEDDFASLNTDVIVDHVTGTSGIVSRQPLNLNSAGGSTFVPWVDIYSWNGTNYVLSDDRFKEYYATTYKSLIERLKSEQVNLGVPAGSREAQLAAIFMGNLDLALERAAAIDR